MTYSRFKRLAMAACFAVFALALTGCQTGEEYIAELAAQAAKGDVEANYKLAMIYFIGDNVDQNDKTGEVWMRKAAELGHPQAQNDMGLLYSKGMVVPLNLVQADKWFILSAAAGYKPAATNQKKFEMTMTPKQIEQAQALAKEWTSKQK